MDDAEAAEIFLPAARAALAAFPVAAADLAFVNFSENATFKVVDDAGEAFVLRLHRPWYHTRERLNAERVWTRALAASGVAVPPAVTTRDGEDYVRVRVEGLGEQRWAGLARWIDGQVLLDVMKRETDPAAAARHFERLGAIMAAMHNQATAWTPPAAFQRHALDADGLMGESPFWGPFWDHAALTPGERALMISTRDAIRAALLRHGRDPAAWSLIHADLHPGNVLIDGDGLAVIDFDDSAFGWHIYDLAVALVFYQDHPQFAAFRDACLRGYRAVRPFPDQELALLPMFLLIRRLVQMGWMHQRPEVAPPADLPERVAALCALADRFEAPC